MARLSEFRNWHNDVCGRQDGISDDNVDITTGVTTLFQMGFDGDQAGYDGIRPATHLGPRGAREATTTAFEGRRRGRKPIVSVSKPRRMALSELRTFSRFTDF